VTSDDEGLAGTLKAFAHGDEGLRLFRESLSSDLRTRVEWLAQNLLRPPITLEEARERVPTVSEFRVLQGDVIRTSGAYQLGNRIESTEYVVASSTCDLVADRRATALLLPIQPRTKVDFASDHTRASDLP
jgi:hypothetical protein